MVVVSARKEGGVILVLVVKGEDRYGWFVGPVRRVRSRGTNLYQRSGTLPFLVMVASIPVHDVWYDGY